MRISAAYELKGRELDVRSRIGDALVCVVNVHVVSAARALPATSFTRGSVGPPSIVTRYWVPNARAAAGVSVAVRVGAS